MVHRIRAAGLIIRDEHMLLVKHVDPHTDFVWWVPPGGGMENDDSTIDACVKREVFEETGLTVDVNRDLRFVREFYDKVHDTLNIELFFEAFVTGGNITMKYVGGSGIDEDYITDVRWCSVAELQDMIVFPEVLKKSFGRDEKNIYLGRQDG